MFPLSEHLNTKKKKAVKFFLKTSKKAVTTLLFSLFAGYLQTCQTKHLKEFYLKLQGQT